MRYSLQIKQVTVPGAGTPTSGLNPAMLNRQGVVDLYEGRPWAGDLYDEGPVSDPAESYAHFNGGPDVEAWLDRNDDGTLTGWVREDDQVWRYSDPEAWALDVDGSQMQRIDAPAAPAMGLDSPDGQATGQDPTTAGSGTPQNSDPAAAAQAPPPAAAPNAQQPPQDPAAQDPTAQPDPQAQADAALTADQNPANGGQQPPVDEQGDATEQYENPFALPNDPSEENPDASTTDLTDANGQSTDNAMSAEPPVDQQLKPVPDANPADPNQTAAVEPDADQAGGPSDQDTDNQDPAAQDPSTDPNADPSANPPADTSGDNPVETPADQLFPADQQDQNQKRKKGKVPPQFQKKSLDVGILPGPERKPRGTVRPRRGR